MTRPMTDLPRGTNAWSREATDAWSREARRARSWATILALALDEEDLTRCDVHGLQALHASLRDLGHAHRGGPADADPRQRETDRASRMTRPHETNGE